MPPQTSNCAEDDRAREISVAQPASSYNEDDRDQHEYGDSSGYSSNLFPTSGTGFSKTVFDFLTWHNETFLSTISENTSRVSDLKCTENSTVI